MGDYRMLDPGPVMTVTVSLKLYAQPFVCSDSFACPDAGYSGGTRPQGWPNHPFRRPW